MHPCLGDCRAWRVVLVEHRTPRGVDLVDVVPVDGAVVAVDRHGCELGLAGQRLAEVLGDHVRHVDPEAVGATVGPETQGPQEVLAHFRV